MSDRARATWARFARVWLAAALLAFPPGCLPDAAEESPIGRAARLAESLSEQDIAQRVERAEEQLRAGQLDATIELLEPVVSRRQVEPGVLELYGRALLRNQRPSLAVWPLARAAEDAAPDSEIAWLYAQALFGGGDHPAAIAELSRLISLAPDQPRLLRLRAQAYRSTLAHEEALADLDRLIALVPDELGALEARIQLLTELERIDEARETIAQLGERLAQVGASREVRGRLCASAGLFEQEQGEVERAREQLLACLEQYPIEPDVVLPWIIFLDRTGEPAQATTELEEIVAGLGGAKLRLRLALADRYAEAGRKDDTARVLEAAAVALRVPQPLFALADHRVSWGDLEGAREAVHRAIELQVGSRPGDPDFEWSSLPTQGRFAFGDILIRAGELEEVSDLIESFEAESVEPVYTILLKARLALENGEPQRALELFEESFKYWPSNVGARYLAGRASMELGEFDRGMSLYQDAFRADPAASDAGLLLARMQAAQGLVGPAADTLSTLIGQKNDDAVAIRLFANLASAVGAFETAEEARQDLATRLGRVDEAQADQAADLRAREGIDAAIEYLEATEGFPDLDRHESLMAWFRLQAERGPEATDAAFGRMRRLIRAAPDSADAGLLEARMLRTLGRDLEVALAAARGAAQADPARTDVQLTLGRLLLEAGDLAASEAAFDRALELEPGDLTAQMGRADAAMAAGRVEDAQDRYREALLGHPWHGRAARALGRIAYDRGDLGDRTLIWARWAARFHEGDLKPAAMLLAELRLARGEPADAATSLRGAIGAMTVPDPRLLYLLGRAFADLGDRQRAAEAISDALTVGEFPEAEAARALLESLRSRAQS